MILVMVMVRSDGGGSQLDYIAPLSLLLILVSTGGEGCWEGRERRRVIANDLIRRGTRSRVAVFKATYRVTSTSMLQRSSCVEANPAPYSLGEHGSTPYLGVR